jgi:hypothetical protein
MVAASPATPPQVQPTTDEHGVVYEPSVRHDSNLALVRRPCCSAGPGVAAKPDGGRPDHFRPNSGSLKVIHLGDVLPYAAPPTALSRLGGRLNRKHENARRGFPHRKSGLSDLRAHKKTIPAGPGSARRRQFQ